MRVLTAPGASPPSASFELVRPCLSKEGPKLQLRTFGVPETCLGQREPVVEVTWGEPFVEPDLWNPGDYSTAGVVGDKFASAPTVTGAIVIVAPSAPPSCAVSRYAVPGDWSSAGRLVTLHARVYS